MPKKFTNFQQIELKSTEFLNFNTLYSCSTRFRYHNLGLCTIPITKHKIHTPNETPPGFLIHFGGFNNSNEGWRWWTAYWLPLENESATWKWKLVNLIISRVVVGSEYFKIQTHFVIVWITVKRIYGGATVAGTRNQEWISGTPNCLKVPLIVGEQFSDNFSLLGNTFIITSRRERKWKWGKRKLTATFGAVFGFHTSNLSSFPQLISRSGSSLHHAVDKTPLK